jgi:hypothetical protein
MNSRKPRCPYCHKPFKPSRFHPNQKVCHSPECQRKRRKDYHRKKIVIDPEYRQVCADSRKKWRENHPGYQQLYRSQHKEYCEQNRLKQHERNQKRQLSIIVKNNMAIDIKRLPAKVWMTGDGLDEIVKNNLAISQVLILQTVGGSEMRS